MSKVQTSVRMTVSVPVDVLKYARQQSIRTTKRVPVGTILRDLMREALETRTRKPAKESTQ